MSELPNQGISSLSSNPWFAGSILPVKTSREGAERGGGGRFLGQDFVMKHHYKILLSSALFCTLSLQLLNLTYRAFLKGLRNVLCHLKGGGSPPVAPGTQGVCREYGVWTGRVHGVRATEGVLPRRVPPLLLPGLHTLCVKHRPRYWHLCLKPK